MSRDNSREMVPLIAASASLCFVFFCIYLGRIRQNRHRMPETFSQESTQAPTGNSQLHIEIDMPEEKYSSSSSLTLHSVSSSPILSENEQSAQFYGPLVFFAKRLIRDDDSLDSISSASQESSQESTQVSAGNSQLHLEIVSTAEEKHSSSSSLTLHPVSRSPTLSENGQSAQFYDSAALFSRRPIRNTDFFSPPEKYCSHPSLRVPARQRLKKSYSSLK